MKCPKCGHRKAKAKPCKFCKRIYVAAWKKTPMGCLRQRFHDMMKRTSRRGWPDPGITAGEFIHWALSETNFMEIHQRWEKSDFRKDLTPSLDRIDSSIPYVMGNIQFLTWGENHLKGYTEDREMGTVMEVDMAGKLVSEAPDPETDFDITEEDLDDLPF